MQAPKEVALQSDPRLHLPVSEDDRALFSAGRSGHRIDVEAAPQDPGGARLDEPRLAQLGARSIERQEPIGRLELGKRGGKEDHAGLEVDGEASQAAEKVAVLPAG